MLTLCAVLVGAAWTAYFLVGRKPRYDALKLEGNYRLSQAKNKLDQAEFTYAVLEDLGVDSHTLEAARLDVVDALKLAERAHALSSHKEANAAVETADGAHGAGLSLREPSTGTGSV